MVSTVVRNCACSFFNTIFCVRRKFYSTGRQRVTKQVYFSFLCFFELVNFKNMKMIFKTYFLACLLIESVRTSDVAHCEKDVLNCLKLDNKNFSPLLKIKNWWTEMSVQKPLKCKTPSYWIHQSPILKVFSKLQPVVSVPCNEVRKLSRKKNSFAYMYIKL